jgi:hypothetical protein
MYQQLWGYKVEEKLYLGVREQKRLNTTGLIDARCNTAHQADVLVVSGKTGENRALVHDAKEALYQLQRPFRVRGKDHIL